MTEMSMFSNGLISIIEFTEGAIGGRIIDYMSNRFFPPTEDPKLRGRFKEIFLTYLQLFISGCSIILIRTFNEHMGIRKFKRKFIIKNNFPPPVALGFGLWYFQSTLKKRVNNLAKEKDNKQLFLTMIPIVIYFITIMTYVNYLTDNYNK